MAANIRLVGELKSYIGNKEEIEVEAGQTLRQVLKDLGMPAEIVALVLVNEEQQDKDYILKEGDIVKLIAVMGGG